jgi:hypothetical protein
MTTTTAQQVVCPVCHQSDLVMTAQKAYERGVTRLAPPVMPVARVNMMKYTIPGFLLVAVGVFFIFIWSGSNGYAGWGLVVQIIEVVLTIAAIVAALVLSFIALLRVVSGDARTQKYLPAYDAALEKWSKLAYCKRDDVVFDPQANKIISDADLRNMLTIDTTSEPPSMVAAHHH